LKNYGDHWGRFLGDWGTPSGHQEGGTLSAEYFNNCVFAMNLMDMIDIAKLLGKAGDANKFQLRLEQLRKDVHLNFYNTEAGYYSDGRQVEQAFALTVGIVPDQLQQPVKDYLINKLKEEGYLDMGSSGLPVLLMYLISKSDLAYLLDVPLSKTTVPSYGYFLEAGETTWPEFWEGDVKSRIHTCYTGISSWFIKGVVGIRISETQPGYQKFIINPTLDNNLTYAKAETESLYGKIKCHWEKKGEQIVLETAIPPNTSAQIFLPTSNINSIKERGLNLDKVKGIINFELVNNQVVVEVESGKYSFLCE
jgi:alpha-L-rhamnosidase